MFCHLVSSGQGCCHHPTVQQGSPYNKELLSPNVSTAGVEKSDSNALPLLYFFPHILLFPGHWWLSEGRAHSLGAAVWSEAIPKVLALAISSGLAFSVTLATDKLDWE